MFQQNSERDVKTVNGLQKKFRLHKHALGLFYGYNARTHTAFLSFAPREVNKNNEVQVHELQYSEYVRQQKAKHKYFIGDYVRKAINKGAFCKSYKFKHF